MPEFADWVRAFAMMGKFGADWKVVALTDDGSMYALLQGETVDEEIRTVRLDEEGRMSAFVIDSVDAWERMLYIGNAELAVRLGSPVSYEQRGRVQFIETFENGWSRWKVSLSGGDAAAVLDPTIARTGGFSVKLTSGDDASHYAQIKSYHYIRPATRWGLEFSFAPEFGFERIYGLLGIHDETTMRYIGVQYDDDNKKLCVYTGADTFTAIADATALFDYSIGWNTIKVVADVTTGKYVRAYFGDQEVDASAQSMHSAVIGGVHACLLQVRHVGDDGENDICNVDDLIVTNAEPE